MNSHIMIIHAIEKSALLYIPVRDRPVTRVEDWYRPKITSWLYRYTFVPHLCNYYSGFHRHAFLPYFPTANQKASSKTVVHKTYAHHKVALDDINIWAEGSTTVRSASLPVSDKDSFLGKVVTQEKIIMWNW